MSRKGREFYRFRTSLETFAALTRCPEQGEIQYASFDPERVAFKIPFLIPPLDANSYATTFGAARGAMRCEADEVSWSPIGSALIRSPFADWA